MSADSLSTLVAVSGPISVRARKRIEPGSTSIARKRDGAGEARQGQRGGAAAGDARRSRDCRSWRIPRMPPPDAAVDRGHIHPRQARLQGRHHHRDRRRGGGRADRRAGEGWRGQRRACRLYQLGTWGEEERSVYRLWF